MSALKDLIKAIDTLEPIPAVINQIIASAEDPNSSMADIADIIIYDPSITANLLRMCNSAYFNLPRKIESVQDAVTMLGLDKIMDLVLLKAGGKNFQGKQDGYSLHDGELWKNAVASALIAKDIASRINPKSNAQMIFTAALLKDIGKVILDKFVDNAFTKINTLVQTKGYTFRQAEKAVIGIDHAELGGIAAKMWDFSDEMTFIIQNHHLHTDYKKINLDTKIVYLADNVCMMMGIGGGSDGLAYRFHKEVLQELGISPVDLQEIIAGFSDQISKVDELIQSE